MGELGACCVAALLVAVRRFRVRVLSPRALDAGVCRCVSASAVRVSTGRCDVTNDHVSVFLYGLQAVSVCVSDVRFVRVSAVRCADVSVSVYPPTESACCVRVCVSADHCADCVSVYPSCRVYRRWTPRSRASRVCSR